MNDPVSVRRFFVDQTIQHWTHQLEEAEQALVEYMENTREPLASRERALRKRIHFCRNTLARFVDERNGIREERAPAPVLRQRARHNPFPIRRHSRSRSRSRSSSRSRGSSRSSRSSASSGSSGSSRSPNRANRGTRRRSRCPRGSNCTIS